MKKLLLLSVLLIFACSFGQRIVVKTYVNNDFNKFNRDSKEPKLKAVDTLNITEFKDKFISVGLGRNNHYLSTSNFKNVKLETSNKLKKKWNVYDGDKLIPLYDEIDILNFFDKYGFEYFKTSIYTSVGPDITTGSPYSNSATTWSTSSSSRILIFKNNNN